MRGDWWGLETGVRGAGVDIEGLRLAVLWSMTDCWCKVH